jgi:hypothetical protein
VKRLLDMGYKAGIIPRKAKVDFISDKAPRSKSAPVAE